MLAREAEREDGNLERRRGQPPAAPAPPPSADALGGAVRRLRRGQGASIEAIALSVGLHPTSVHKIERAERRSTWTTLCDLAAALGVSVSALVETAEREAASVKG